MLVNSMHSSMPPEWLFKVATRDIFCSEGAKFYFVGELLKVGITVGLGCLRSQHRSRKIA